MAIQLGRNAEMRTGEGKTLVSTLAAYLNALGERGVHLVTVNDYLAKRDSEWMGQVYNFLGMALAVSMITTHMVRPVRPPMIAILPTARIMNMALIICAII